MYKTNKQLLNWSNLSEFSFIICSCTDSERFWIRPYMEIRPKRSIKSVSESIDMRFVSHVIKWDLSHLIVQENANASGFHSRQQIGCTSSRGIITVFLPPYPPASLPGWWTSPCPCGKRVFANPDSPFGFVSHFYLPEMPAGMKIRKTQDNCVDCKSFWKIRNILFSLCKPHTFLILRDNQVRVRRFRI